MRCRNLSEKYSRLLANTVMRIEFELNTVKLF